MSLHLHLHMHRTRLHARLALLLTSCMDDGVLCINCPRCYSGGYKAAKRAVDRRSRRRRLYVPSPNPLRTSSRPVVLARRACSTQP
ncbi:hypothetical protein C8J57DRAFT_1301221 [Mycena rebaudengoi]|nr:hypothetical protein C8J57DRAFT_1301221 [Mycena rebaudengoi]